MQSVVLAVEKRVYSYTTANMTNGHYQSSLTLSLLRCIYTDGNVYYDGIPTASINLDALRTNITIIPQMVSGLILFFLIHSLLPTYVDVARAFEVSRSKSLRYRVASEIRYCA